MVFLRALLLWALVSVHIVGAAFLFRRLFPRESRWLAFIIPEVIFVLACNFIEHHIALTVLRLILPVTTFASLAAIVRPPCPWRVMRLPTCLFLGAFAFSVMLRALRPDLEDSTDAIYDLGVISHFMFGQTLPAEASWLPPVKLLYYYCLPHYGASVLIRLLGVDMGTGYNLAAALLSAYIYFLAGATAWHLGRGKLWITLSSTVLTACAATGSVGYLWLTLKDLLPENTTDLNSLLGTPASAENSLLRHLVSIYGYNSCVLFPPGIGSWTGNFHSMNAGQLIICFALLSFVELVRRKQTNWPWICLAMFPFLMLTTCTWGVPMAGLIAAAGLIVCVRGKIVPENLAFVIFTSGVLVVLLEPMLAYFLNSPSPPIEWVPPDQHTQILEFLAQWWPVFLPGLALCCIWKRVSSVTRTLLVVAPLSCLGIEILTVGWRSDMTGKSWALIFAAAWIVFLPEITRQRAWPYRLLFALIALNCTLSLCFWTTYYARTLNRAEIGHLEGLGAFRLDRRKARILETLSHLDAQTVIPGRVQGVVNPNNLLVELTHNRAYVASEVISDDVFYANGINEAGRRFADVDALYNGTLANPIYFLRQRNISAVVIYPDDNIDAAVVEGLKKDLAPYYTFEDASFRSVAEIQQGVSTARPCAGVFIYHPEISTLVGFPPGAETK